MPREIIDTQSSRPAYRRRRLQTLGLTILALLVVVVIIWTLVAGHHGAVPTLGPGN